MKSYFVYILASKKNGTLYIGVTSNLEKRIWEHKNKVVDGFTEKYNVDKLVYRRAMSEYLVCEVEDTRCVLNGRRTIPIPKKHPWYYVPNTSSVLLRG
jgi:hypothetical protein